MWNSSAKRLIMSGVKLPPPYMPSWQNVEKFTYLFFRFLTWSLMLSFPCCYLLASLIRWVTRMQRLSACRNLRATKRTCVKYDTGKFLLKLVHIFEFWCGGFGSRVIWTLDIKLRFPGHTAINYNDCIESFVTGYCPFHLDSFPFMIILNVRFIRRHGTILQFIYRR